MAESSGTEAPPDRQKIDTSIGTIVWVRRRNGSWWPGRILGPEELSTSHLMSPRSGTPVKLLGRDDASVDWYNIEKSKRVKPFRCGEYDECIEKAKASATHPTKKIVKYARREDAILHALELEKKQLMQKQDSSYAEMVLSDENNVNNYGSDEKLPAEDYSQQEDSNEPTLVEHEDALLERNSPLDGFQSAVPLQQVNASNVTVVASAQDTNQSNEADIEDDNGEGMTRMRGLQDFGLKTASKRKQTNLPANKEGIPKIELVENVVHNPSYINNSIGSQSILNDNKGSITKKRGQIGPEENISKRRYRRRPILKVLESSAKLQVPSTSEHNSNVIDSVEKEDMESNMHNLQLMKANQTSISALPKNSSDCTGNSLERDTLLPTCLHVYDTMSAEIQSVSIITENTCSNLTEQKDAICCDKSYFHSDFHAQENAHTDFSPVHSNSTSKRLEMHMMDRDADCLMDKEGLDETGFASYYCPTGEQSLNVPDQPVSKWQSKGKRNVRCMSKKQSDTIFTKTELDSDKYEEPTFSEKSEGDYDNDFFPDECLHDRSRQNDCSNLIERKQLKMGETSKIKLLRNNEFSHTNFVGSWKQNRLSEGFDRSSLGLASNIANSSNISEFESAVGRRVPEKYAVLHTHDFSGSVLLEVPIRVQNSYQGEHVPIVSLMSRLNGKPIVGHPVTVETMEDGYCDVYFGNNIITNNPTITGESSKTSPVSDATKHLVPPLWRTARRTDMQRVPRTQRQVNGNFTFSQSSGNRNRRVPGYLGVHDKNQSLKNAACRGYPSIEKKSSKSSRRPSYSSKKTRTLSSIGIGHESKYKNGSLRTFNFADSPIVTCIPLRLVFSRIKEAVGNSSKAGNYSFLSSG